MGSRAPRAEGPGESRQPGSALLRAELRLRGGSTPQALRGSVWVSLAPQAGCASWPSAQGWEQPWGLPGRRRRGRFLLHTGAETSRLYF